jgi:hypothetical protein
VPVVNSYWSNLAPLLDLISRLHVYKRSFPEVSADTIMRPNYALPLPLVALFVCAALPLASCLVQSDRTIIRPVMKVDAAGPSSTSSLLRVTQPSRVSDLIACPQKCSEHELF